MFILRRLLALLLLLLIPVAVFWVFSQGSGLTDKPGAPQTSPVGVPAPAPIQPLAVPSLAVPNPYPIPSPRATITPRPYPLPSLTPPMPTLTPIVARPTITLGPTSPLPTLATLPAIVASSIQYTIKVEKPRPTSHDIYLYSHWRIPLNADFQPRAPVMTIQVPAQLNFNPFKVWISPGDKYRVFMQSVLPGGIPYVVNQTTGNVAPAVPLGFGGGDFYGWHSDNRHFLFWVDTQGLWLIDAETLTRTTLARPYGPVQGASLSPNGNFVAYIDPNPPVMRRALWLVSKKGGDAAPLLDVGGIARIYPQAWASDNRRLAFFGSCGSQPLKSETEPKTDREIKTILMPGPLCVVDVQTRAIQTFTVPADMRYEPTWSPNGRYLATTGLSSSEAPCTPIKGQQPPESCLYSGQSIYLVDTVTGQARELTAGIMPVWSPDGSSLAFLSYRSGAPEIWSLNIITSDVTQLTADGQSKDTYNNLQWFSEVQ